ncbi:hypothetical protein D9M70_577620 [compost metagenome]
MQLRGPPGKLALQGAGQKAAEQPVIAVPVMQLVRWLDEQVGALELVDQRLAVMASDQLVTERRAEVVEDAGLQQEVAALLALAREDVLGQVVGQLQAGAGERVDEGGPVAAALQGQGGQVEGGDPAFGAALQAGDFAVVQLQTAGLAEVAGGLLGGEA